jgi:hypothetical protein
MLAGCGRFHVAMTVRIKPLQAAYAEKSDEDGQALGYHVLRQRRIGVSLEDGSGST